MSLENFESKKTSKEELIREKMVEADKIDEKITLLIDSLPEGETKEALKENIEKRNKLWEEITKLMED